MSWSRQKKIGSTLDLSRFLQTVSEMREVEQSLGLIGQAYEGLRENGEFWLKPGKWVRISLESYCLNSGLASPVSNELYGIDKMPAKYEDWLPPLLNYTRTHPGKQRKVQHLVWKLSRGAEYQDLNDEEKKFIKEAIPDFTKPFSGLVRFFKGWAEDWKTLFQDITRVEADLDQRKSKLPLSEPPTRWLLLKNGLGVRVDYAKSYQKVYLTVVNLNLPNQKNNDPSISNLFIREAWAQETEQIGEALVFDPGQYILEPGRQDVQPLGIAPVWGDPQMGEVADLLSQIHKLLQEIGVSVIPGVNDVVDFYEFLFGKDYLSGRDLTPFERSLSAVGFIIGSGHGFRKSGEKIKNIVDESVERGLLKRGEKEGAQAALDQAREYLGEEGMTVLKHWHPSTLLSAEKSIMYHFERYALKFQKPVAKYTQDALNFFSTNKQWKKVKLRDGSDGLLFRKKGQMGGYFTTEGQIVSFWYE